VSYQFDYIPKLFKEKLEWENQIKDQQSKIRASLNFGSLTDIANTVKTLELMITEGIIPKEDSFKKDLDDLNNLLEAHFTIVDKNFNKRLERSLCPSVLRKPSRKLAPRWYYESKFELLCNFFDRLGLGFQHDSEGHL